MKDLYLLILLLIFSNAVHAQTVQSVSPSNEILRPEMSAGGIVFSGSRDGILYIENRNYTEALTTTPGSGRYFAVSRDGKNIGFKYINSNGQQIPALIDPSTKKITKLWTESGEAGQVSFADNGTIAFTIGKKLIIKSRDGIKKYDLGSYANIAPVSRDGTRAAFNDNSDQLYIINLKNGIKQKITDDKRGYFMPQWSPDAAKLLYSNLNSELFVYDLSNGKTYRLGEGYSPSWSNDSQELVYFKTEVDKMILKNSDIYLCDYNGGGLRRLTSTPGIFECDPSFTPDGRIIYSYMGSARITEAELSSVNFKLNKISDNNISLPKVKVNSINSTESVNDANLLDMPYINQRADVPDYFNGNWACGPTSAMMVLAYYKILPVWSVHCSYYGSHYSSYGRYISDTYRFKGATYSSSYQDPNGRLAQGAYGYMWAGSNHPYSAMVPFFRNHGVSASLIDSTMYSTALKEVQAGRPFVVCVALTSAGHIVVAHDTTDKSHTLIFNDPYGDKNKGYWNYYGQNVKYDWPGYNNGFQNLSKVYWSVSVNYEKPAAADTLIDDLDFYNGFFMRNQAPASMATWKDLNQGYRNHMWFTYTHSNSDQDTDYVTWTPALKKAGYYKIEAYIPMSQAVDAQYHIYAADGEHLVSVNQEKYTDSWVPLGTFNFNTSDTCFVRLGDASSVDGQAVIFDAMRWTYVDSSTVTAVGNKGKTPAQFNLEQNYPNPFNPSTTIKYHIPEAANVILKVYDILGNEVAVLVNRYQSAGLHSVSINTQLLPGGKQLSSGFYFYEIQAGNYTAVKKMILMK